MYPDLAALMILMFVAAFTPGPNNLLSSYSGFNFGIKRTLPLIYGVTFGFPLLIIIINSGLIIFFKKFPALQEIIKILGSVFILYFAYKVALSKRNGEQKINICLRRWCKWWHGRRRPGQRQTRRRRQAPGQLTPIHRRHSRPVLSCKRRAIFSITQLRGQYT